MDRLAPKVARRFLADVIGDPVKLLDNFKKFIEWYEQGQTDKYDAAYRLKYGPGKIHQLGIESLFLALLQNYDLKGGLRRTIEEGARAFAKTRTVRPRDPLKAKALYDKKLAEFREWYEAAKKAVQTKPRSEIETHLQAGPFRLVNTGGFDDQTMEQVQKVVEQAASKLQQKGLGKVCYGDILVSNSVGRSSRVLAFYHIPSDEMFVRANLKGSQRLAMETVIHELGHRLHFKFLKGKDIQIQRIYAKLMGDSREMAQEIVADRSKWPQPGEVFQERRKTYVVDGVEYGRGGLVVKLHNAQDPNRTATLPLLAWAQSRGETVSSFVSPYAKKNHVENFAEMVRYFCMGTLPDDQVRLLEEVL